MLVGGIVVPIVACESCGSRYLRWRGRWRRRHLLLPRLDVLLVCDLEGYTPIGRRIDTTDAAEARDFGRVPIRGGEGGSQKPLPPPAPGIQDFL